MHPSNSFIPRHRPGYSRRLCSLLFFFLVAVTLRAQSASVPPLYGPAGVSARAVRQGQLGSCFFHASIAAIANRNPEELRGAIRDLGGGDYTVRFVDGRTETVHTEDVMFARRNRFDLSDGLWVGVLLRGMAQSAVRDSLMASIAATPLPSAARSLAAGIVQSNETLLLAYDRAIRATITQDGDLDRGALKTALNRQVQALQIPFYLSTPVVDFLDAQGFFEALSRRVDQNGELFGAYRSVGQGGLPSRVIASFDRPTRNVVIHNGDEARRLLARAQRESLPMVASTGDTLDRDILLRIRSRDGGPDWWVPQHAYSVIAYNPQTGQVTLRNPWARHPDPDGVFTVPLSDFLAAYTNVDLPTP